MRVVLESKQSRRVPVVVSKCMYISSELATLSPIHIYPIHHPLFPLIPAQAASEVVAFARSDLDAARSPSEIAAARDFLHTALTRERVAKKRVTVMVGRRILKAASARVRAAEQEVIAASGVEARRLAEQRLEAARDELVSAEHTVAVSAGQQLIHAARQRVADLRCVSRFAVISVLVK